MDQHQAVETARTEVGYSKLMAEFLRDPTTADRPPLQELLKVWVRWAFAPSKRRYSDTSMVLKHEVERLLSRYYVPEREFTHAMVEAGFPATKEGNYHLFNVKDSLSRKTYFRESRWYGSVPHPLERLDPSTEFEKLPSAERRRLSLWIATHVGPPESRETIDVDYLSIWAVGSDCPKRLEAALCGALMAAGYPPVNPTAYYWRFHVRFRRSRSRR